MIWALLSMAVVLSATVYLIACKTERKMDKQSIDYDKELDWEDHGH